MHCILENKRLKGAVCRQGLLERLLVGFAALGGCAALDAPDPATSNKSVDSKASAKTSPLATGSWRSFSWILSDKNRKEPLVLVEQSLPSNQEEAVCANDQAGLHGMLRPLPGRKLMLCASERLQPQAQSTLSMSDLIVSFKLGMTWR